MIRMFGRGKPKSPPPNLTDTIENVDKRAEAVEKKIEKLEAELKRYKDQIVKMREGPAKDGIKQKAIRVLQQKRTYESQLENLRNQSFNMEQTNNATQALKDTQTTLKAMKDTAKTMRKEITKININRINKLQDEMVDLMEINEDIQEAMGRSYEMPIIDEDELQLELDALGEEISQDNDTSYLDEIMAPPTPSREPDASSQTVKDNVSVDEFGLPKIPVPENSPLKH